MSAHPHRSFWILPLLLLALQLAVAVGRHGFWGSHGEGRRAEVAREAVDDGHWLVPHLLGEPFITKPPLAYWLMGLSLKAGRMDEDWARLPAGLATLATAALCAAAMRRAGGTGLKAGLVFAASPLVVMMARNAETEPLLLFFVTLAGTAYLQLLHTKRRIVWTLVLGLALAGGFMVKGPLGWLFPAIPIVFAEAVLVRGHTGRALDPGRWALILLCQALLVVPWFVYVWQTVPDAWDIWHGESIRRAFDPDFDVHREPWWYYVPRLAVFLPWIALLPGALLDLRAATGRSRVVRGFLLAWFAGGFLLLSAVTSKRTHYMLSLFPALSMLVSMDPETARSRRWFRATRQGIGVFLVGLGALLAAACLYLCDVPAALAAAALTAVAVLQVRSESRLEWLAAVLGLLMAVAATVALPRVDSYRSPAPFYREVSRRIAPDARIANWKADRYSASFYLRRNIHKAVEAGTVRDLLGNGGFLMTEARHLRTIPPATEIVFRRRFPHPLQPDKAMEWVLVRWRPDGE